MRSSKETIDTLIFEIHQLELHSNQEQSYYSSIELYASALDLVKVISLNDKYEDQIYQFDELIQKGRTYRELPHGVTDVILAYVHDLNIIIKAQS